MGLSFPLRFFRSALGPKLRNVVPVENPETQVPDTTLNALFHASAGMALGHGRVNLVAAWNGVEFDIDHQSEAWNPDGEVTHPALARMSAGFYTYTFQSTYPDEDGEDVPTVLPAPRVTVHKELAAFADRVEGYAWVDGLIVHVRLWLATDGTPVDEPFWLEVL